MTLTPDELRKIAESIEAQRPLIERFATLSAENAALKKKLEKAKEIAAQLYDIYYSQTCSEGERATDFYPNTVVEAFLQQEIERYQAIAKTALSELEGK